MKSKATALLLSYARQSNLLKIINSLRSQSAPIEIFLWNNNPLDKTKYDVDLQIDSSKNLMCWPRWFMANYASSDYIFSLDDDFIFRDEKVIEDCIFYCQKQNDKGAIGFFGVHLNKDKSYWGSKHLVAGETDKVDILKGRFIFCPKSVLRLNSEAFGASIDNPRIEDDIFISSLIKNKTLPLFLRNRFLNLPDYNNGLYAQKEHKASRQDSCHKLFK
jgi:hypothetical protein